MSTSIPTMRSPSANAINYNHIPADTYPARIVRFVGLGLQPQPEFQGQKKDPAFKCAVQFELIGMDATGTKADGTPIDPRPACVFQDYFLFPNAQRGKVFDMCRAVDPSIQATPKTLEWFIDRLGEAVLVQVGTYQTRDGVTKNKVVAVTPMPSFMKGSLGAPRTDLVGFNPYSQTDTNLAAYGKMFKFQRDMLTEAIDTANIPFAGREAPQQQASSDSQTPTPSQEAPQATYSGATTQSNMYDDDMPF